MPDIWSTVVETQDLFEPGGRVCVNGFIPLAVLMPGHADEFDALLFHGLVTKPGDAVELEYRIDAEDMQTIRGTASATIPTKPDDFLPVA